MGEKVGGVFTRAFASKNGKEGKVKPARVVGVKRITKEFYARGQDGSKMKNEAAKAAELLTYIKERIAAHEAQHKRPMTAREVNALGFDVSELERGRIRPAPLGGH